MANLRFEEIPNPDKKTRMWEIYSEHNNSYLGRIGFYAQWRKYVFGPLSNTLFDVNCLTEITNFLIEHKDDRQ